MHDVLVIGAGTAGCVLAARLSEDPATRVLLVEAGPEARKFEVRIPAAFSKLFDSKVDWGYRTTRRPHSTAASSCTHAAGSSVARRRSTR